VRAGEGKVNQTSKSVDIRLEVIQRRHERFVPRAMNDRRRRCPYLASNTLDSFAAHSEIGANLLIKVFGKAQCWLTRIALQKNKLLRE
jgi:hypothetical protein